MVKNVKGGNKGKSMARKHVVNNVASFLRVSNDEGEIYSIVTKILGNNMFHCHGIDDKQRLGHIRGKFSGRGRRDNIIELGTWVLIGIREWEENGINNIKNKKISQCDLLEVYNDMDKEKLKDTIHLNWSILQANDCKKTDAITDNMDYDDDVFVRDKDEEKNKLLDKMKTTYSKITLNDSENNQTTDDIINIDDI